MIKKRIFKKFIAGMISFSMCFSVGLTPNTVFAEEDVETISIESEELITADLLDYEEIGIAPAYIEPGGSIVPIYRDNKNYSFEERAADLIARMTQQEKLSQMVSGMSVAVPRLGLNWWGWWNECLHGVSRYQNFNTSAGTTELWNTVSYPITLSMGASWDADIMYRVAKEIGEEARETADGNYRNLSFYTPTVNLSRDPRWGRGDESQGEDPFLSAAIASQFVNGMEGKDMQGNLLDPNGYLQAITTLKHYMANNTEHNRLNGSSNMSERDLREYYLDVYRRIIRVADPGSVMNSYQRVNEVPSTVNMYTQDTLLRQTLGFNGFITTDCDSMGEVTTVSGTAPYAVFAWPTQGRQAGGHGWRPTAEPGKATAANTASSSYTSSEAVITNREMLAWAAISGTDVECNGGVQSLANSGSYAYVSANAGGNAAVNARPETPMGTLTVNAIDINAHRLLTARMKIGEFDMHTQGTVKWYDEVKQRISENYGEDWVWVNATNNGAPTMTEERKELAREAAEKSLVLLRNDPVVENGNKPLLPLDVSNDDLKIAVIGYAADPNFGPSTGGIGYVSGTNDKLQGGYSARFGESSFPQFVYGYKGIEAAINKINPNVELRFERATTQNQGTNQTQINANAFVCDTASVTSAAEWADVCIVYVYTNLNSANEERDRGISSNQNSDNMSNATLALAPEQVKMINTAKASNKNIILVMETSGPNFIESFEEGIPAMIYSSFNGQEKGNALANVLLGEYNPSARTSITWFKDGQLSDLRSYKMAPGTDTLVNARANNTTNTRSPLDVKGRTYMYYSEDQFGDVMFPFGYGLSYTDFAFSNFSISSTNVNPNQTITVSFDVKNTGSMEGSVVPQLYVKTPVSFGDQYPIKRLRGFEMVKLAAGATKNVTLTLPVEEFAFFNDDASAMKYEVKPGTYRVQISDSSADEDEIQGWDVNVSGNLVPSVSVVTARAVQEGDQAERIPNRLIFDKGVKVDPQLTVCMSDEALYGHVNLMTEENTADYPYVDAPKKNAMPSNLKVTYSSNRPNVVDVDGSGNITTRNAGVATITATVHDTISNTTGTCDFIVYVKAPEGEASYLTSLTVGGKELFDPEKPEVDKYDIGVLPGTTKAPTVTATAPAGNTVTVQQAKSIPGTAYVRVTNQEGIFYNYAVNIGYLPTSDSLTEKNSSLWKVMNGQNNVTINEDGISWTIPRPINALHSGDSGFTNGIASGNGIPQNIHLQENIVGDWEASVKVSLSASRNGINAGLVLYQERANNVALTLHRTSSSGQIRFYHANNAVSRTNLNGSSGVSFSATTAYLKLAKTGNTLKAYYSSDGENWTDAGGSLELSGLYRFPSLGFYAATDTALTGDSVVTFKDFQTTSQSEYTLDVKASLAEVVDGHARVNVTVDKDALDVARVIYVAAYNENGKLLSVSKQEINSETPKEYSYVADLNISKANGDYDIKVFAWGKDSKVPYIDPITVEQP